MWLQFRHFILIFLFSLLVMSCSSEGESLRVGRFIDSSTWDNAVFGD